MLFKRLLFIWLVGCFFLCLFVCLFVLLVCLFVQLMANCWFGFLGFPKMKGIVSWARDPNQQLTSTWVFFFYVFCRSSWFILSSRWIASSQWFGSTKLPGAPSVARVETRCWVVGWSLSLMVFPKKHIISKQCGIQSIWSLVRFITVQFFSLSKNHPFGVWRFGYILGVLSQFHWDFDCFVWFRVRNKKASCLSVDCGSFLTTASSLHPKIVQHKGEHWPLLRWVCFCLLLHMERLFWSLLHGGIFCSNCLFHSAALLKTWEHEI